MWRFFSSCLVSGIKRQIEILQILYDLCFSLSSFFAQSHSCIDILIVSMQLIHYRQKYLHLYLSLSLSKSLKKSYCCFLIDSCLRIGLVP